MQKKGFLSLILALLVTSMVVVIIITGWVFQLDAIIKTRLEGKRFLPPIEFFSAPLKISAQETLSHTSLQSSLKRMTYENNDNQGPLRPGQYLHLTKESCQENLSEDLPENVTDCLLISKKGSEKDFNLVSFAGDNKVSQVFSGEPLTPKPIVELEPILFAQYYGTSPILRDVVSLGEAPPLCLNAILAIEDSRFLEHSGVSLTGYARAAWKNLTQQRAAQGGSTITQQLVKNYFLTPEKTIKRKVTEGVMSLLLELRATKDEILETYINEIYMGQNGPFEVRGFGAASNHYLSKSLSDLDLAECSLLAAILNNPGMYNPFTKTEAALKRRNLVLAKMLELELISEAEKASAEQKPLPKTSNRVLSEPAPYFVDAVRRELEKMALPLEEGARVFTTLDLRAQEAAQKFVREGLDRLESSNKKIRKIKETQNKSLEGSLVSADPKTGEIKAIVGGRSFKISQYNRAYQSKRQVGSVFKPLVYLAALELGAENEIPTPITLLKDEKFTVKYDGQSWSPVNYDKKQRGLVPVFYALSRSLNIPTAQLGISIGLKQIVEFAETMGVKAELKPVPALALGAFEMTPLDVLQTYSILANFGERVPLTLIRKIETASAELLYLNEPEANQVADPVNVAILVGMLKQTVANGTAWFLPRLGFTAPAAGKTGTTSDARDAWFAGMTPEHVAVAWVGYDDNTESGLTGASGAIPIWANYMIATTSHLPALDFEWPEGAEPYTLSVEQLIDLNVPEENNRPLEPIELIFRAGTTP